MSNIQSSIMLICFFSVSFIQSTVFAQSNSQETNFEQLQSITCYGRGGQFGYNRSDAGDVNGDGYDDLIVTTVGLDKAYLYLGGSIVDTVPDLVFHGQISSRFGSSVAIVGDMNGDGFEDIVIGAFGLDDGRAFLYLGGVNVDNIADLTFLPQGPNSNTFGYGVSGAGDINNDGYSDLTITDKDYNSGRGRSYIYLGGSIINNIPEFFFEPEIYCRQFGFLVSKAGDIDNDGFDDVMFAAIPGSSIGKGMLWVLYGSSIPNSVRSTYFYSDSASNFTSIDNIGDLNGDNYEDIVAGVYSSGIYLPGVIEKANIYFGRETMNTEPDIVLTGESLGSFYGRSVAGIGDINKDGFNDVAIGAELFGGYGKSYIYFGGQSMNLLPDIELYGLSSNMSFGRSSSAAGDMNGDGFDDFTISGEVGMSGQGLVNIYFNTILLSPSNSSVDNPLQTTLKWKKIVDAKEYIINVSSDSLFNTTVYSDTLTIDTLLTLYSLQRNSWFYWKVGVVDSSGSVYYSSVWKFKTIPPLSLDLKVLFEGMYYPLFNQMSRRDSVKVYLRSVVAPFQLLDSSYSIIDSLTFRSVLHFENAYSGIYYIIVKHFNSIETWSKEGGTFFPVSDTIQYDFTSSISQSYGNNLKPRSGKYCIYTGDINQSGFIDGSDALRVHSDSRIFLTGRYLVTDLNADGIVDGSDYSLVDNNAYYFVGTIRP